MIGPAEAAALARGAFYVAMCAAGACSALGRRNAAALGWCLLACVALIQLCP